MAASAGHNVRPRRPLHPPFTHFPVAAYVLAAAFDLISVLGGRRHQLAGQLWHAGTFVLIAGLVLCLVTMLTGFADLVRFVEHRPATLRIVAKHVCVMAAVFMIGVGDLALRLSDYHQPTTPPAVLILTITAAVGVCTGAFFGGTLVYRHGTGVSAVREPVPVPVPVVAATAPTAPTAPIAPTATVAGGRRPAPRTETVRHRARRG
jgi:uncharacterized membrane protein